MPDEKTVHSTDRRVRKYRIVKRSKLLRGQHGFEKSLIQVAWEEQWPGDNHWKRRTKRLTYDEMHNAYTEVPPM